MNLILNVLGRLLALLDKWVARQEHKKAQEARNALEQNPAEWFDSHFDNGVPTDKPSKTDQTDTTDSKTK
jgi:hypothetical protein